MIGAPPGDTIFALSSGAPPSAIAIVRVSGPDAATALTRLAGPLPEPRRASHRTIHALDGSIIDRGLVLWFPGERTVTGEPVAEFHLHGSRAVVALMGTALSGLGLRAAEPGEFTRRGFLNGRIDLLAAEGLADLLAAETEADHRRAVRLAEGGLGREVDRWRDQLLRLAAQVEAVIEFGETDDDAAMAPTFEADLLALSRDVGVALARPPAERLRDGVRIVVAGPPNSGKSSLVNALAGRDVALATPIAGTTRDLIEAPVAIGGRAILLIDTAGLREAADAVERLGVVRARQATDDADIILWCGVAEDCPAPERSIVVVTRADERDVGAHDLAVSINWPASLDMLLRTIDARCEEMTGQPGALLLNVRQRDLATKVQTALAHAVKSDDPVIVAAWLREGMSAIDRLIGRSGVEDMLGALFGQFCIGK